jgi:tetratricopeptide (TPR) repeat protein
MGMHERAWVIEPEVQIEDFENLYQNIRYEKDFNVIGQRLFESLACKEVFDELVKGCGKAILPIIIQSNDPHILQLPWNLLYCEPYGFLACNKRFTLSLSIPDAPHIHSAPQKGPLRILFFSSAPDNLGTNERLGVEDEQVAILEAFLPLVKEGFAQLKIPNDGRFDTFQTLIEDFDPHLVYLSGHGSYDPKTEQGSFLFEDQTGLQVNVDEQKVADQFAGSSVECVVLSSCQSAQSSSRTLNSGLAQKLAFEGIHHVVGMNMSVYDVSAKTFNEVLSEQIARRHPVGLAVQHARRAVSQLEGVYADHWAVPVLFSNRSAALERPLIDWDFEPQKTDHKITSNKLGQILYPELFIGRRRDFRKVYDTIYKQKNKHILLFGEGGMGKTAFAAKVGIELRNQGYKLFDYSIKHGDDFESFLLDIEMSLPAERVETYDRLKSRMQDEKQKAKYLIDLVVQTYPQTLFIFDNLESIQNPVSKVLERQEDAPHKLSGTTFLKIKAWIEALLEQEDVLFITTSRWKIEAFNRTIQLNKPLWEDFLYYMGKCFNAFDKQRFQKVYELLGGNFRGAEFYIAAIQSIDDSKKEEEFLVTLQNTKEKTQADAAIETILSYRSTEDKELLERLCAFSVPVDKKGVDTIAQRLDAALIENLVDFSLVQKIYNPQYKVDEYQISALVYDKVIEAFKARPLYSTAKKLAANYQRILFEKERKTLSQAVIVHQALHAADEREKAHRFALDWIVGELNRAGLYQTLLDEWLTDITRSNDSKTKSEALGQVGKQYVHLGQYHEALEYLEQSLKISQAIGDRAGEGTTLNNISSIYQARGKYDEALEFLEQSLKIYQAIGDRAGEGTALNNISQIYDARGKYDEALNYLEQSLEIYQAIGNRDGEGTTLNNISQIYKARGKYDEALEYLEQSLKISQAIGDRAGEGTTLNNISLIYQARGKYDEALEYLEQSLKIYQAIGDRAGEGTILNNISQIYKARGKYDEALEYLEQSLKIYQAIGDRAGMCATLFNLGHIYVEKNAIAEAMGSWVTVYKIAKAINLQQALDALEGLSNQNRQNGLAFWEEMAQQWDSEDSKQDA